MSELGDKLIALARKQIAELLERLQASNAEIERLQAENERLKAEYHALVQLYPVETIYPHKWPWTRAVGEKIGFLAGPAKYTYTRDGRTIVDRDKATVLRFAFGDHECHDAPDGEYRAPRED